ncbi:hypothetical protein JBL43_04395 [Aureibaculum sp. A20]|uniref:Uncharacterized protein n=1 Tax=Aureibaculum flavum TaxID=2795986 RepID=A0ABS0WNA5_9FLAO|nr:hypothetical protein [Aureibaculum flavum]MBJ2173462.1 hypothetical protein [Aureibaculum flavum]
MISEQQLYQQVQGKTRVVILASKDENNITAMLLHVLNYYDKQVDFVLANGKQSIDESNEFIVIEAAKNADALKGNIALVIDVNPEIHTAGFVNSITNGGMLVYYEEVAAVKLIVESSTNTIKKYPYKAPDYSFENEVYFIDTNEGKLPLEITNENDIKHLLGAKWICQHMGVDEDDFYEAVGEFRA